MAESKSVKIKGTLCAIYPAGSNNDGSTTELHVHKEHGRIRTCARSVQLIGTSYAESFDEEVKLSMRFTH